MDRDAMDEVYRNPFRISDDRYLHGFCFIGALPTLFFQELND